MLVDGGAVKGRGAPSTASLPLRAPWAFFDRSAPGSRDGVEWSHYTTNHTPKEGLPMLVKTVEKHKGFV